MLKRTQLKRKTPLKRGAKRLKARGASTRRWEAWRKHEREAVMERADGRCERCGVAASDWHHAYGRNGEPWASSRWLTTALCRPCHQDVHTYRMQRDAIRWAATLRLWAAFKFTPLSQGREALDPQVEAGFKNKEGN